MGVTTTHLPLFCQLETTIHFRPITQIRLLNCSLLYWHGIEDCRRGFFVLYFQTSPFSLSQYPSSYFSEKKDTAGLICLLFHVKSVI